MIMMTLIIAINKALCACFDKFLSLLTFTPGNDDGGVDLDDDDGGGEDDEVDGDGEVGVDN